MSIADSGTNAVASAKAKALLPREIMLAKEAKNERDCLGKPLGCSMRKHIGD